MTRLKTNARNVTHQLVHVTCSHPHRSTGHTHTHTHTHTDRDVGWCWILMKISSFDFTLSMRLVIYCSKCDLQRRIRKGRRRWMSGAGAFPHQINEQSSVPSFGFTAHPIAGLFFIISSSTGAISLSLSLSLFLFLFLSVSLSLLLLFHFCSVASVCVPFWLWSFLPAFTGHSVYLIMS